MSPQRKVTTAPPVHGWEPDRSWELPQPLAHCQHAAGRAWPGQFEVVACVFQYSNIPSPLHPSLARWGQFQQVPLQSSELLVRQHSKVQRCVLLLGTQPFVCTNYWGFRLSLLMKFFPSLKSNQEQGPCSWCGKLPDSSLPAPR